MNPYAKMSSELSTPQVMAQLTRLYGSRDGQMVYQINRCKKVLTKHEKFFNTEGPVYWISAPGRVEIGGNHTDHNRGKVLAASANLDILAAVSPRGDRTVNVRSDYDGYKPLTVDLNDLEAKPEEQGTTAALIRGVAAKLHELGHAVGGFDAVMTSGVPAGSGLSSSAALEVLLVAIFDRLYGDAQMDFVSQAKIGRYAENVYFGKPSGLLDQMASAAGGLAMVDFRAEQPTVKPLSYDFESKGYALVVVGTGGSHADLTAEYAAIPTEMKQVAAHFGKKYLREVMPDEFKAAVPALRRELSDRAIMRAAHFFRENTRVCHQMNALLRDDLPGFLREIRESGRSSFMYLQNVWCRPEDQSLSLALCMAEDMLGEEGACRIHGGGFAGTTLNFVPMHRLDAFVGQMNEAFGKDACHVLNIRPVGAYTLQIDA